MDHAEREYLPAANVHRLLCERTGCALNPIVDKPPHPDCPPGFYSPAAVLEAGQEGELEVLVAAGLTALPLHIPDLLSLAEGVGNDPDALLVVSRWHPGRGGRAHRLQPAVSASVFAGGSTTLGAGPRRAQPARRRRAGAPSVHCGCGNGSVAGAHVSLNNILS